MEGLRTGGGGGAINRVVEAGANQRRCGSNGTFGIESVCAVVGLGEAPPGVVEFCLFCPVFEAVGLHEGEEVDAELGFAKAGEFEVGYGRFSQRAGQPVEEAFADAGGVANQVRDLPVLEVG